MNEEDKLIILIILFFLSIIGVIIFIIVLEVEGKPDIDPDAKEFCVKKGYMGARMSGLNSGYCYYPHDKGFGIPREQYFGWDGTNWRFVGK